jgi:uncharacterized protein YhjY with autotransporter beta-barrel domain
MKLRSVLLAGVSVATLATGTPAPAATLPGVEHDVVDNNVDDTLNISLVGDPPVTHGDIEQGTASATAFLNLVSSGQIVQIGFASGTGTASGNAHVAIENGGTASLVASAIASQSGGPAKAVVIDLEDIFQVGDGIADGSALIENTGKLEARAVAAAHGSSAQAAVLFNSAIFQQAIGNHADAAIVNSGLLQLLGSAVATANAGAAAASVEMNGIHQFASGATAALAHLTNMATYNVTGVAHANGASAASAIASASYGVLQSAVADGPASVTLDNVGLISIAAIASAKADGFAHAGAAVGAGMVQLGDSLAGDDLAIHNSGTYEVSAIASADAGPGGLALVTAAADLFFQSAFAQSQSISFSSASGVFLKSSNVPRGPASAELSNSGDMMLLASAHAHGQSAFVLAAGVTGGTQTVEGSSASASITNTGKIDLLAVAKATGTVLAGAAAFASGLHQFASAHSTHFTGTSISGSGHAFAVARGAGPASVSLVNSGTIDIVAQAHAVVTGTHAASGSLIAAAATAEVPLAILQGAAGTSAHDLLENNGTIRVAATASASATQNAGAQANEIGIVQAAFASGVSATSRFSPSSFTSSFNRFFQGPASVELTNSGTIDVTGLIDVSAGGFGRIDAHGTGIHQIARGTSAFASIVNEGSLTVAGSGHVHGASETGFVFDSAIHQNAIASVSAVASVHNSGHINVLARDIGSASAGLATNVAIARGIAQSATVATPFGASAAAFGTATENFENSGTLSVAAEAKADGGKVALGVAFAAAVVQAPIFGTLNAGLDNEGDISALAAASGVAHSGPAFGTAHATDYLAEAGNVVADVVNSGSIEALASVHVAGAGGSAFAFAAGLSVNALSLGTPAAFGDISGSITNQGLLSVAAKVDSTSSGTIGAVATGIFLSAPVSIDATVTNSGTIDVTAITAHQGNAQAWGIHVFDFAPGVAPEPGKVLTINNSGTIIARQSDDGGATFTHGFAIDVSQAPNPSVINLLGGGMIYGDIAVQAGDVINVTGGTTTFDGIINPEFLPPGGVTAALTDSGLAGIGTLNIEDGGNLILADPRITGDPSMFDGPAFALIDTLNVASDGTLTIQLQPESGGLQSAGGYPQVFANTANLDGTLAVDVTTPNGLFADSYDWQNVIDANVRTGTFSQCVLGGPLTGSLLLDFSCSYDSNANVDLALTRKAFASVAGLNADGAAVASGLDSFFDVNLTGGAATMFADLFKVSDPANYNIALNMLSGSSYANYLNSFSSLGVHENDLVDHATNCEIPALAGSVLECRGPSPIRVWGQLDYQTRRADGDVEAGDSRSKRFAGLVGLDADVGNAAIIGGDVGYLSNNVRDAQFGDTATGKGWTAGLYGAYDARSFFVKALGTYSSLGGDSTRHIDFSGLGAGTGFIANPRGRPDARMWTFGLHGGARFNMGASSVITPYLDYDYINAKLKGFTEQNGNGAGLTIESSTSNHSYLTGGVKWATELGGVLPEVNLGYRYRFGDQRSTIGAFFTPDPENNFDVISAAQKRGSFLAGLSVGGKVGPVDLRIGYEGEFNGAATSHSGNFKIVLPLGGHAAPPPPPPPPAPV